MAASGASALLIVDVQNDFCPGGSLAVPGGDEVVDVINRVSHRFARVVATQDWHPPGHVSFASSHAGRSPLERVEAHGVNQLLWPDHCVQGSWGAELHAGLDLRPVGCIIRKGTNPAIDSYSAFFENDRKTPTGLKDLLFELGISRLYVTGLATDYCVLASALDAARLGFRTTVVVDAVRGVDAPPGSVEQAFAEMGAAGVERTDSAELASR